MTGARQDQRWLESYRAHLSANHAEMLERLDLAVTAPEAHGATVRDSRGRSYIDLVAGYGVFNFGGAFALAYYGFVQVHAGLGQTLLALVPLATLLLAVVQRQERLRVAAVVGTLLALVGIAVMSRGRRS